jgi:hypothetical protein
MPEKFVTVASYTQPIEAQLAKGRLEDEGIKVFLTGDLTANTFSGLGGLGGQVQLQVPEADVKRAEEILAACAEEEALDEDWEERVEEEAGVWTCSLCGTPVDDAVAVCPSCETPREAVQNAPPSITLQRRRMAVQEQSEEGIQRRGEVTKEAPLPAEMPEPEGELDLPKLETFLGDDLARRAFRSGLISLAFFPLGIYTVWLLLRLAFFSEEVSPAGIRKIYGALFLAGLNLVYWIGLLSWLSLATWFNALALLFLLLGISFFAFVYSRS